MMKFKILVVSILSMALITACASTSTKVNKVETKIAYDNNGEIQSLILRIQTNNDLNDPHLLISFEKVVRYAEYSTDVIRTSKGKSRGLDVGDAFAIPGGIFLDIITLGQFGGIKSIARRSSTQHEISSKREEKNRHKTGRFDDRKTAANGGALTLYINGKEVEHFAINRSGQVRIRLKSYSSLFTFIPDILDVKLVGTTDGKTAEVNKQVPWASTLNINSSVPGAQIFINGKRQGKTPQTLKFQPGSFYKIMATKNLFATRSISGQLKAGQKTNVNFKMSKIGCQKGNCKDGWGELQTKTSLYKGEFQAGKKFGYGTLEILNRSTLSGIWDQEGLNVSLSRHQLAAEYKRKQSEPKAALLLDYKNLAAKALKKRHYKTAKSYLARIMIMGQKIEDYLYFHYGRTLIKTGDKKRAAIALKTYLQVAGKTGKYIKEAKSMLHQVDS